MRFRALATAAAWAGSAAADLPVLWNDNEYASTKLHTAPTQRFKSSDIIYPRFDFMGSSRESLRNDAQPLYTFLSPSGPMVPQKAPLMVKRDGTLIWLGKDFGESRNFQVQAYKGVNYLTFFRIEKFSGGHASGYYYMLDSNYNIFKKFIAGNGLKGDLHEFKITESDTALVTVYTCEKVDLSSVAYFPFQNWIWESRFQEIDLESGKILFEWRASDHYKFSDDYRKGPEFRGWFFAPWDWFHINSIDKDAHGNYLISSRHLTHIACISGITGNVLWKLGGGKLNEFTDLSNGSATDFQYQHHASWVGENQIILFDNGINYEGSSAPYSRGLHIHIDVEAKTAKRVAQYVSPQKQSAETQGSFQILPNGNILIGWGSVAAFTEFTVSGDVVLDSHFVPIAMFSRDGEASYRTFQYPWVGLPLTKPDIVLGGNSVLFVSWNGATEVKTWLLQHSNDTSFDNVTAFAKDGFETSLCLASFNNLKKYIQVLAIDSTGTVLGVSQKIDRMQKQQTPASLRGVQYLTIFICIGIVAAISVRELVRRQFFKARVYSQIF